MSVPIYVALLGSTRCRYTVNSFSGLLNFSHKIFVLKYFVNSRKTLVIFASYNGRLVASAAILYNLLGLSPLCRIIWFFSLYFVMNSLLHILALVHVHSRVRLHVSVEWWLLLESFVTEGALVRRLVLVNLFVHAQCLWWLEIFACNKIHCFRPVYTCRLSARVRHRQNLTSCQWWRTDWRTQWVWNSFCPSM